MIMHVCFEKKIVIQNILSVDIWYLIEICIFKSSTRIPIPVYNKSKTPDEINDWFTCIWIIWVSLTLTSSCLHIMSMIFNSPESEGEKRLKRDLIRTRALLRDAEIVIQKNQGSEGTKAQIKSLRNKVRLEWWLTGINIKSKFTLVR